MCRNICSQHITSHMRKAHIPLTSTSVNIIHNLTSTRPSRICVSILKEIGDQICNQCYIEKPVWFDYW